MNTFLFVIITFLLINILVGMVRLVIGPTSADRVLAVQLFGTTGMAVLLLMSVATGADVLINIALVFALLAVMTITAFVKRATDIDGDLR